MHHGQSTIEDAERADCYYRGWRKRTPRANERRSQLPLVWCVYEACPEAACVQDSARCFIGTGNGISIYEKNMPNKNGTQPSRMKIKSLSWITTPALCIRSRNPLK